MEQLLKGPEPFVERGVGGGGAAKEMRGGRAEVFRTWEFNGYKVCLSQYPPPGTLRFRGKH